MGSVRIWASPLVSGSVQVSLESYAPSHLGGGWFDYCCEFATDYGGEAGFDASSDWGRRVEWAHELRLDASKILQLRTEDDLLDFVREYGIFINDNNGELEFGEAPAGRPPWASANAEMRDVVHRSSSKMFENLTPFGSDGMAFFASASSDAFNWRRVAVDYGGIEVVPYRNDDPWRCGWGIATYKSPQRSHYTEAVS